MSVPTFVHALLVVAVLGEGVGDGVGRLAQNLLRPSDRFHRRRGRRLVVGDIFDVDVVIVVLVADGSEKDVGLRSKRIMFQNCHVDGLTLD